MGGGVVSSHKLFSASWERFIFFLFVLENAVPEGVCFSIHLFAVFQYLLSAARNQFVLFKHNIECKITIFRLKSEAIFSLFCQYTNGLRKTVSEQREKFEILSWTHFSVEFWCWESRDYHQQSMSLQLQTSTMLLRRKSKNWLWCLELSATTEIWEFPAACLSLLKNGLFSSLNGWCCWQKCPKSKL